MIIFINFFIFWEILFQNIKNLFIINEEIYLTYYTFILKSFLFINIKLFYNLYFIQTKYNFSFLKFKSNLILFLLVKGIVLVKKFLVLFNWVKLLLIVVKCSLNFFKKYLFFSFTKSLICKAYDKIFTLE